MKKEVLGVVLLLLIGLVSSSELKVTNEHPFLIKGEWIVASSLEVGDELTTLDGVKVIITSIKDVVLDSPVEVYNLEAGIFHDFVVEEGVVVHNSDKLPCIKKKGLKSDVIIFGRAISKATKRGNLEYVIRMEEKNAKKYGINARSAESDFEHYFTDEPPPMFMGEPEPNVRYEWPPGVIKNYQNLAFEHRQSLGVVEENLVNGQFYFNGQKANGRFNLVVDEEGTFTFLIHDFIDPEYPEEGLMARIPHAAQVKDGLEVYGAGEAEFEDGYLVLVNTRSGHYADFDNIDTYNKATMDAFRLRFDMIGLKIKPVLSCEQVFIEGWDR